MRLLSARVRNYRVHEDVEVRFHAATSLLGGENEAGKSTLVEAVHRALFLTAKGDTQAHKAMLREGCKDRPEVVLRFEKGGEEWELRKHFGGSRGHASTLKRAGHPPLKDDEAEGRLAELTGAAVPAGKQLKEETVRMPWSHLWVWQGAGGNSPTGFIEGTTDELVRITSEGAGAVLMSEMDGQLATRFRAEKAETYGATAKALVNSALGRANTARDKCDSDVAELNERVDALSRDADRYADASRRLQANEPRSKEAEAELGTLEIEITAGRAVRLRRDGVKQEYTGIHDRAEAMRKTALDLKQWQAESVSLAQRLENDAEVSKLGRSVDEARTSRDGIGSTLAEARQGLASLAARRERAAARVRLLNAERSLATAEGAVARVERIEKELGAARDGLSRLPNVSAQDLSGLRADADAVQGDRARLEAVSSTLEVTRCAGPPVVDGTAVAEGERVTLRAETVLDYAGELSIRLVVPDAASADELRASIAQKEAAIARTLAGFVIDGAVPDSIERLADVVPRRQVLDARITDLQGQLETEDAEAARAELLRARSESEAARVVDRDLPDFPDWSDPSDLAAAQDIESRLTQEQGERERRIEELERRLVEADRTLNEATALVEAHAVTRREYEDRLRELRTLVEDRLRHHDGEHDAFTRALTELEQEEDRKKRALDAVQRELDETALDTLEIRRDRLIAERERLRTAIERARDDLSESRGRLRQPDGSDPHTELREARERLVRCEAACERKRLDAEATALLHELFQEGIDAANESVTRPLAEKVEHYLRHLFGPQARVSLRYADGRFGEFYLVRPGFAEHEEAFSSLSGGAREQVAAAVRLATAELLAEPHGGTLPVVFDDAFVNTDPGRIDKVISMLYQAGENGLQVIVATCDPERYRNVGQVQWTVNRGAGAREV